MDWGVAGMMTITAAAPRGVSARIKSESDKEG